jgi:hypothetical protein
LLSSRCDPTNTKGYPNLRPSAPISNSAKPSVQPT